jgi:hypothetical protein
LIDGIIKYRFDFKQGEPLAPKHFCEIETLRERLFSLGLIGAYKSGVGYGNISQRNGQGAFVITGTQTGDLAQLGAEHYALVEAFDDRIFYLKSSGAVKPSSEALTHGTVYNLSSEIGAVIHIHSKKIWNFMLEGTYLKTADVEYGTEAMIDEVNRIYATIDPLSNPKFVMAGHEEGVMVFGRDLVEAELALYGVLASLLKG